MVGHKRIFVLYTGGTIGMKDTPNGLIPDDQIIDLLLEPFHNDVDFDCFVCQPLIDSSAVTISDWNDWLKIISKNIDNCDGILVLHGTDTMAYTANILKLSIPNLQKPIVLTGSQKPYHHEQSDAKSNINFAMKIFSIADFNDVVIAFNNKIIPAIGSSKISTIDDKGFDNHHFGIYDLENIFQYSKLAAVSEPKNIDAIQLNQNACVATFFLTPGYMIEEITQNFSCTKAKAIIIQSYGHGNTPRNQYFLEKIQSFIKKGGIVLNISQVDKGEVLPLYEQGEPMRQIGVISGGKANIETAIAILTVASSNDWNAAEIEENLKRLKLI